MYLLRSTRSLATSLTLAAATLSPTVLAAQNEGPPHIPTGVISVGGAFQVSQPRGDFKDNTGTGYGLSAGALFRIDKNSILNWRADAGFLTYGNSKHRIPLAGTGGLIELELKTSNDIFSLVTGPQIGGTRGPFTPYAAALGGFSVFSTSSSVEGTDNDDSPFASTTNNQDVGFTYGAAAGLYIKVYGGDYPVRLDLGASMFRHDNIEYLNKDRVEEAFKADRKPIPIRGRADFITYRVGVSVWVY